MRIISGMIRGRGLDRGITRIMAQGGRSFGFANVFLAALAVLPALYFGYAAIQGEYGMLRLVQIEAQEMHLTAELENLRAERAVAMNLSRRISDEYLDLDLLEEQARRVLGMARGDEIIIR